MSTTRPIRVAQICGATDGALWMVQIAAGLRERGYDVLAVIGSPNGETAARLREAGIPFEALTHNPFRVSPIVGRLLALPYIGRLYAPLRGLSALREAIAMARLLRRYRIDITHTHVITSNLVGRIAALLARVPVRVAMIAGPYHLEAEAFRRLDLATAWMDHRILAGSARTDELYAEHGVPARRRTVVPYGADPTDFDPARVDPERFRRELGVDRDTPLIGQVAYFYPVLSGPFVPPLVNGRGAKGHEDFVDAAKLVRDVRPDARFVLVGGGFGPVGHEHFLAIQDRVAALGIADAVIFTGKRSDIPSILAALDVSVQCSLSENYGGTLESLLMCAPTIATRVGGMPEVVRHEQTGLLVPPRDPAALAAAMLRLIEERDFAHELGRAGRQLILDGFTIQHTIDGVDRAYRELARERGLLRPPILQPA